MPHGEPYVLATSTGRTEIFVTLSSEDDVKKALGIDSWRNLSKDKIMRFAAMMPDMDKEVALSIVAQLPTFTRFALDTLNFLERAKISTEDANELSQENAHAAYRDVRAVLKGELDRDDLSPEDRMRILDSVMETADKEAAKDSENKRFLTDLFTKSAVAAGAVVAAGLVFVGGKVMIEQQQQTDETD